MLEHRKGLQSPPSTQNLLGMDQMGPQVKLPSVVLFEDFTLSQVSTDTLIEATGIVTLVPTFLAFADFLRLFLVSLASIKLLSSITSDYELVTGRGDRLVCITAGTSTSRSLDFGKASSAKRSCN